MPGRISLWPLVRLTNSNVTTFVKKGIREGYKRLTGAFTNVANAYACFTDVNNGLPMLTNVEANDRLRNIR